MDECKVSQAIARNDGDWFARNEEREFRVRYPIAVEAENGDIAAILVYKIFEGLQLRLALDRDSIELVERATKVSIWDLNDEQWRASCRSITDDKRIHSLVKMNTKQRHAKAHICQKLFVDLSQG